MRPALCVAALLSLVGCEVNLNTEGIVSTETKRFTVTGTAQLQLDTFDGSIEVHSWDRNEVEVEIERRAMEQQLIDDMKVTAEQDGNTVRVKVTAPRREDRGTVQIGVHFSPSARLRVALPRQANVLATSGDGSITLEDVRGKIELRSGDGSIRVANVSGELLLRTADGSIRGDRLEGGLDIETDDGSITLEAKPAVLKARTSDGSIRLEIQPESSMTADWDVETGDGSVTLRLPASFNALIDAETRDGSVRTERAGLADARREAEDDRSRDERRRMLRAPLGSGGHTLRLRTGDGTIRIE